MIPENQLIMCIGYPGIQRTHVEEFEEPPTGMPGYEKWLLLLSRRFNLKKTHLGQFGLKLR